MLYNNLKPDQNEIIANLKEQLQEGSINPNDLNPIAGSFKLVAQIKENIGLAWNYNQSSAAFDMFQKENQLLNFMQSLGLPAINFYTQPFKLTPTQWAVLLEWVPNATFIDVKDSNLHCKLTALTTGYPIPTHESWAMQKDKIEQEIKQKLELDKECLTKAKMLAKSLHIEFSSLQTTLNTKQYLIADLQLLIAPTGQIKIIDPIDIVKVKNTKTPNQFEYQSILDSTNQQNPDFIKLVLDGKKLIQQAKDWCLALSTLSSQEEWIKFILYPTYAEEIIAKSNPMPFSNSANLLLQRKNMKPKSIPLNPGKKFSISAPKITAQTHFLKEISSNSVNNVNELIKLPNHSPEKVEKNKTPHHSPEKVKESKTPPHSPEKVKRENKTPPHSPQKRKLTEQEIDPTSKQQGSPTKVVSFQFANLSVNRRLNFEVLPNLSIVTPPQDKPSNF